jgi:hypothetical protein
MKLFKWLFKSTSDGPTSKTFPTPANIVRQPTRSCSCKCGERSQVFDPSIQWDSISDIPFEEAMERHDICIDNPVLYSNEPTKDAQACNHVRFYAILGHHVEQLKEKKDGSLVAWAKEIEENPS